MSQETRIQLCGRLVVRIAGADLTDGLPGRKGLTALRVSRARTGYDQCFGRSFSRLCGATQAAASPDKLIDPVVSRPAGASSAPIGWSAAASFVSTCRATPTSTSRRHARRSTGPRARCAAATGPKPGARRASRSTWTNRTFLAGEEADWINEQRRELEDVRLRAHDCVARSGLGLGGPRSSTPRCGRVGRS